MVLVSQIKLRVWILTMNKNIYNFSNQQKHYFTLPILRMMPKVESNCRIYFSENRNCFSLILFVFLWTIVVWVSTFDAPLSLHPCHFELKIHGSASSMSLMPKKLLSHKMSCNSIGKYKGKHPGNVKQS